MQNNATSKPTVASTHSQAKNKKPHPKLKDKLNLQKHHLKDFCNSLCLNYVLSNKLCRSYASFTEAKYDNEYYGQDTDLIEISHNECKNAQAQVIDLVINFMTNNRYNPSTLQTFTTRLGFIDKISNDLLNASSNEEWDKATKNITQIMQMTLDNIL